MNVKIEGHEELGTCAELQLTFAGSPWGLSKKISVIVRLTDNKIWYSIDRIKNGDVHQHICCDTVDEAIKIYNDLEI